MDESQKLWMYKLLLGNENELKIFIISLLDAR